MLYWTKKVVHSWDWACPHILPPHQVLCPVFLTHKWKSKKKSEELSVTIFKKIAFDCILWILHGPFIKSGINEENKSLPTIYMQHIPLKCVLSRYTNQMFD